MLKRAEKTTENSKKEKITTTQLYIDINCWKNRKLFYKHTFYKYFGSGSGYAGVQTGSGSDPL